MARYDLSETEWRLIAPLLPNKPRGVGRVDDRRVLNGIFYVLRAGAPWRDLPERYGPYTTVYNRFDRSVGAPDLGEVLLIGVGLHAAAAAAVLCGQLPAHGLGPVV